MRAGRPRRSGLIGWVFIALLAALLTGCAQDADMPQNYLDPAGPVARMQDDLWDLVFPIAVGVFIFVQAGLLYVMWRFRGRGDDGIPHQLHGNTKLELLWTIIPALILAGVAVPTTQTIFDLAKEPEGALQVRVIGKQFWWEFEYLGEEGQGVVTANELHIPTGRPVYLKMESLSAQIPDSVVPGDSESTRNAQSLNGVIHSFWVPKLGGKQDVVPGHVRTMYLEADTPGRYEGQCAEFCGIGHAVMRLAVVAHEPGEFDNWLSDQAGDAFDGQDGLAARGKELFETAQCIACHAIRGYETSGGASANVRVGPDLTHFASRMKFAGGMLDNADPEQIREWLRNPQAAKQGAQMPNLGLSEGDIEALIAYLQSLK